MAERAYYVTAFVLVISAHMMTMTKATPTHSSSSSSSISSDSNTTSLHGNMTTLNTNMTAAGNESTFFNSSLITSPTKLEIELSELRNETQESFMELHESLASGLQDVVANFSSSIGDVHSDSDAILKRLNDLETSLNEVKKQKKATEDELQAVYTDELSCRYIYDNVSASMTPASGLYWLRDRYGKRYITYCEFDSAGRSWTLVGSVHENRMGLGGRCSAGDRWSNDRGHLADADEDTAWSDFSTFGDVTASSSGDYKNAGYFSMKAKNLMIWQVREHTDINKYKEQAYLRYRTTDNVLQKNGGNLYSLFQKYPHKPGAANYGANGPISVIVYDKGSWEEQSFHLGAAVKSRIIANRMHFRAVNQDKDTFALCPGGGLYTAAADYHRAELFCLGSNKRTKRPQNCGDFAAWDSSGYGTGVDNSADMLLVKSAFLMFYG